VHFCVAELQYRLNILVCEWEAMVHLVWVSMLVPEVLLLVVECLKMIEVSEWPFILHSVYDFSIKESVFNYIGIY
jgi:hypothetical protein